MGPKLLLSQKTKSVSQDKDHLHFHEELEGLINQQKKWVGNLQVSKKMSSGIFYTKCVYSLAVFGNVNIDGRNDSMCV